MLNSSILDVAIGVVLVYVLLSLMCAALREGIEGWLKTRSAYLEYGIRELLHDVGNTSLTKLIYSHPLILGLFPGEYQPPSSNGPPRIMSRGKNLPSYIPSRNFSMALLDLVARGPLPNGQCPGQQDSSPLSVAQIRVNVEKLQNPAIQRVVLNAIDTANNDLQTALRNIEAWYDSAMDRVAGRYKRSSQLVLFVIGALLAVGFNVNTIELANFLYRNQTERGTLVARAQALANQSAPTADYKEVERQLMAMKLPIGWDRPPSTAPVPQEIGFQTIWQSYLAPVLGWLMTAFAMTLGAPFWFDVLNKVMVIRSTVKPHEKSPEEASEDRQLQARTAVLPVQRPASVAFAAPEPIPGTAHLVASSAAAAADDSIDSCDGGIGSQTPDEALPYAQGGVVLK